MKQIIAKEIGAKVIPIAITDEGEIDLKDFESKINNRTKMAAFVHVSNALGTINPAKEMIATLKSKNIPVLLDGAQAVAHQPVDVQDLDCDFYVFSSHKLFGPDGIGVLYGRSELLTEMPPYQGGGDMINIVSFEGTTFRSPPERFEAGTPNIAQAICLGSAVKYIESIGMDNIQTHEHKLTEYALEKVSNIKGLKYHGTSKKRSGVISFNINNIHPQDLAQFLDQDNIAIRVGQHCAQPLLSVLDETSTARISFYIYNTKKDVDNFCSSVEKIKTYFFIWIFKRGFYSKSTVTGPNIISRFAN